MRFRALLSSPHLLYVSEDNKSYRETEREREREREKERERQRDREREREIETETESWGGREEIEKREKGKKTIRGQKTNG